jgi:expansin (peptidoglycan-binding protein)
VLRPFLAPACARVALASFALVAACGEDTAAEGTGGGLTTQSGTGIVGSGGDLDTPLPTAPKTGIATFYDYSGTKQVACSFDVGGDTDITAINDGEYAKSAACGACLAVVGPKGTIKVRVVDRCPGCASNHIDLSAQAFAKIADPIKGRVPITYEVVACDVPSVMSYRFKEGSSKYWTAIQVRDHRIPITKVEYKKNGAYTNMPRTDYNYFVDTKGVGNQPDGIALRVTAADGAVVEETIPNVQAGQVFPGTKQFE